MIKFLGIWNLSCQPSRFPIWYLLIMNINFTKLRQIMPLGNAEEPETAKFVSQFKIILLKASLNVKSREKGQSFRRTFVHYEGHQFRRPLAILMGKRIGKSLKSDQKFHNFSLTKRSKIDPKLVTECKMRTWIKPSPSWTSRKISKWTFTAWLTTLNLLTPSNTLHSTKFQILKVSSSLLSLIVRSDKMYSIE